MITNKRDLLKKNNSFYIQLSIRKKQKLANTGIFIISQMSIPYFSEQHDKPIDDVNLLNA